MKRGKGLTSRSVVAPAHGETNEFESTKHLFRFPRWEKNGPATSTRKKGTQLFYVPRSASSPPSPPSGSPCYKKTRIERSKRRNQGFCTGPRLIIIRARCFIVCALTSRVTPVNGIAHSSDSLYVVRVCGRVAWRARMWSCTMAFSCVIHLSLLFRACPVANVGNWKTNSPRIHRVSGKKKKVGTKLGPRVTQARQVREIRTNYLCLKTLY